MIDSFVFDLKPNKVIEFDEFVLSQYNFGMFIIRDDIDIMKRPTFASGWVKKLVWQNGVSEKQSISKYGLCSVLTDGWTFWIGDKQELIYELNNYTNGLNDQGKPHIIKWRILTKEELLYILTKITNPGKQLVRRIS